MINGYFAAGGTAAILVFVLSVAVPAPGLGHPAAAGRLGRWPRGSDLLAVMLIWPPRERATLRADAARAAWASPPWPTRSAVTSPTRPRPWPTAAKWISGLRGRLTATPHRPTGPTRPTAALDGLIDELGWLFLSFEMLAGSPEGELCVAENTAAMREVATVLRACAAELDGEQPLVRP